MKVYYDSEWHKVKVRVLGQYSPAYPGVEISGGMIYMALPYEEAEKLYRKLRRVFEDA